MSQRCPAGCCPHDGVQHDGGLPGGAARDAGCPADLPAAPLAERAAHLYRCQRLSTYQIAALTGAGRQRISRLLHQAGVVVKPRGAGRTSRRTAADERLGELMAWLYLEQRMTSMQVAAATGIPDRTVRDRLRARGVRLRTRGRFNREDRAVITTEVLARLYLRAGLTADEAGRLLGVSRRIVLRSAHDEGVAVRVGGPPPARGPSRIELLAALYADPQVSRVLRRHGIPVMRLAGPIWARFPEPCQLTADLVTDLYQGCGLSLQHVELLTGQPATAVSALLRDGGVQLRPPGGRSPFIRRWRESRT